MVAMHPSAGRFRTDSLFYLSLTMFERRIPDVALLVFGFRLERRIPRALFVGAVRPLPEVDARVLVE